MNPMLAARSGRCIALGRVLQRPPAGLIGLFMLVGCAGLPDGSPVDRPDPTYISEDAGTGCAHPEQGCACDPGQPPIDCYLDPIFHEGRVTCSRGTRYCRQGVWTGCESVRSYELRGGPGIAALVTGPTECNACDPACAVSRDVPTAGDLPGRSTDVEYDPVGGGISIVPIETGGTPDLPDSDGDGVPDVADECDGPGALPAADGSCYGDLFFYHELPYGGPVEIDPLEISVQVRTADVYFLMDTTGSMFDEIDNLQRGLTSGTYISGCGGGIIGAIRCTIPDAWFGVGYHDDYPVSPYGGAGDDVYRNLQDITSSVSAAQSAVNSLSLHWGNDNPESQTQALWAVATGGGLGPYLSARSCSGGRWGYPCFRAGTIPIVILFTDAPFHNGPSGYNYSGGSASSPAPAAVSGNDTVASARVVGDAATTWQAFSGNTCGLAHDYGSPCAGSSGGDAVFQFTVSTRRSITITTRGSSYDTALSLRRADMSSITCNDDENYPSIRTSQIVTTLDPGTYYAVVTGWSSECGDYQLTIGDSTRAVPYPISWSNTVSALNAAGIRVITIHSGGTGSTGGISDARALADATGSVSGSGSRYVFSIPSNGTGLSSAVVDAVVDLANYNRMDIGARAVDNPATAGIDERGFVESITAVGWGPGSCSGTSGGHTFVQCLPGTHVDFNVAFRNDFVMPTSEPQVFDFWIEVIGNGTFVLERVPVRIVVPSNVPTYPASGSYWRDYDSTVFCESNERPDWNNLSWEIVDLPADTSIRWEIRASQTLAGLATATPVTFTAPPTSSPIDIGARLTSAGIGNYVPYLRVTAVLLASPDRERAPTLRSFEVRYTCIPQE